MSKETIYPHFLGDCEGCCEDCRIYQELRKPCPGKCPECGYDCCCDHKDSEASKHIEKAAHLEIELFTARRENERLKSIIRFDEIGESKLVVSLRKQLEIAMEAINRIAGTEDIESREIAKDTLSKLKGSST